MGSSSKYTSKLLYSALAKFTLAFCTPFKVIPRSPRSAYSFRQLLPTVSWFSLLPLSRKRWGGGGGYVGGGGGVWGLLDVGYVEGVRWRGGKLGWGGGVVDVKSWSKMLFLGTFWKITTCWSPLDERVRSSFAEKRNVESGTSTREDRSKTAQILLEKPFKNHRKK